MQLEWEKLVTVYKRYVCTTPGGVVASPFRSLVLKVSDSSSNVVLFNKGFLGLCYAITLGIASPPPPPYTHTSLAENYWFE